MWVLGPSHYFQLPISDSEVCASTYLLPLGPPGATVWPKQWQPPWVLQPQQLVALAARLP